MCCCGLYNTCFRDDYSILNKQILIFNSVLNVIPKPNPTAKSI